jgi:hypothetical protein
MIGVIPLLPLHGFMRKQRQLYERNTGSVEWRDKVADVSEDTVFFQLSIHEEIKRRMHSGSACYHSVQNLLSSSLLSENVKIKIYRTIILRVVLCGYESWSLTLREEGVREYGAEEYIWA